MEDTDETGRRTRHRNEAGVPQGGVISPLLEGRMGLRINREKTRMQRVKPGGEALNFLGHAFRWKQWRQGQECRREPHYLSIEPPDKAQQRFRDRVRELTSLSRGWKPIQCLVLDLNAYLRGWQQYFDRFHRGGVFRKADYFVYDRVARHLKRRSQRPFRPPKDMTWYAFTKHRLGVLQMSPRVIRISTAAS